MPWKREPSRRVEAGPEQLARFSGTSAGESPFSSETSRSPLLITGYLTRYGRFRHFSASHLKRSALHDTENEGREAVFIFFGVSHDFANSRRVVILNASSERERQKVFRQSGDKQFGTGQQRVFQSVDPAELPAAGQSSRRIDGLPLYLEVSPLSHRIEVFEREAHRINRAMTARACGVAAM